MDALFLLRECSTRKSLIVSNTTSALSTVKRNGSGNKRLAFLVLLLFFFKNYFIHILVSISYAYKLEEYFYFKKRKKELPM